MPLPVRKMRYAINNTKAYLGEDYFVKLKIPKI